MRNIIFTSKMKKINYIIIFFFTIALKAQVGVSLPSSSISNNSKWIFGGYAGLNGLFGNNSGTTLYLTPKVGYKIHSNLIIGFDGNFSWSNSKYSSSTILGTGPFVDYYFQKSFYVSANFRRYFISSKLKSNIPLKA